MKKNKMSEDTEVQVMAILSSIRDNLLKPMTAEIKFQIKMMYLFSLLNTILLITIIVILLSR